MLKVLGKNLCVRPRMVGVGDGIVTAAHSKFTSTLHILETYTNGVLAERLKQQHGHAECVRNSFTGEFEPATGKQSGNTFETLD